MPRSLGKEHAELSDLTDDNVRDCMEHVAKRGRSVPTVNDTRKKLCALWNFLARKAIVSTYPEVLAWVEPEKVPIAWMTDELARIWNACRSQQGWIASIPAGEWWLGLHSLLYDCGERIGAVMQLEWRDVNLHSRDVVFSA